MQDISRNWLPGRFLDCIKSFPLWTRCELLGNSVDASLNDLAVHIFHSLDESDGVEGANDNHEMDC